MAGFIAARFQAADIIKLYCGDSPAFCEPYDPDPDQVHAPVGERWISVDGADVLALPQDDRLSDAVVMCSDISGREAERLAPLIAAIQARALAVIVVAPVSEAASWAEALASQALRPTFEGPLIDATRSEPAHFWIFDRCDIAAGVRPPDDFQPLALLTTYNDDDVIGAVVATLLDDGIEILVLDNWSTDGTFERLKRVARARPGLTVRRYPEAGPAPHFDLLDMCRTKEALAAANPGRWIIHQDSDEIRCSPWPGVSMRQGLFVADQSGFNAVDFTVCVFRPTHSGCGADCDPERSLTLFEFDDQPGSFWQVKAWFQGAEPVDLVSVGGHQALFSDRRIFPYKFILKHYPLRSPEQGRRKVFRDRLPRYSPEEIAKGWHHHYNHLEPSDPFLWDPEKLIAFDEAARNKYLLELLTGIGLICAPA